MGDHDYRQFELALQLHHQLVERCRADRIEAGRGLIEEQQPRVECERARQRGTLDHSAGQLARILLRRLGGQADEPDFQHRELVAHPRGQVHVLDHGQLHVLHDGERGEERALLERHPVARFHCAQFGFGEFRDVAAFEADGAFPRSLQSEDGSQ